VTFDLGPYFDRDGTLVPYRVVVPEQVETRDQGKCQRCGRAGKDAHHRKPKARGGPDRFDNLIYLCRSCHDWAHADLDAEFDGYLIPSHVPDGEIADVPVFYFDRDSRVRLGPDGTVNDLEAA